MIALARFFLRKTCREPIRYRWPHETVIITGCSFEKIDAHYDAQDRLQRMIVYTRYTGQAHRARSWLGRR